LPRKRKKKKRKRRKKKKKIGDIHRKEPKKVGNEGISRSLTIAKAPSIGKKVYGGGTKEHAGRSPTPRTRQTKRTRKTNMVLQAYSTKEDELWS